MITRIMMASSLIALAILALVVDGGNFMRLPLPKVRPRAQQLRLPIVSGKPMGLGTSPPQCAHACGGASYCACDSNCVCVTINPLPILTEVQRAQNTYNAGQMEMAEFVSAFTAAVCTDKQATMAEVLYFADGDSNLKALQVMMFGNFDDVVRSMLDCTCSVDISSLVIPYQKLHILQTCKTGLAGSNGTQPCAPGPTVETFKEAVRTLLGRDAMCSNSCRRSLGLLIDHLYGVSKLFIAPALLFKKLPYPIGRETFDCVCGTGTSPAFGFGALADAAFAPFVIAGSFESEDARAEQRSPAHQRRILETVYSAQGLCSGACSELWDDVEVVYDAMPVSKPTAKTILKADDTPLAQVRGPAMLGGQTYGELMNCKPAAAAAAETVTAAPVDTEPIATTEPIVATAVRTDVVSAAPRPAEARPAAAAAATTVSPSSSCPGGSLVSCIGICPSNPAAVRILPREQSGLNCHVYTGPARPSPPVVPRTL